MELLFGVIGRGRGPPAGWNENIIGKSVGVGGEVVARARSMWENTDGFGDYRKKYRLGAERPQRGCKKPAVVANKFQISVRWFAVDTDRF